MPAHSAQNRVHKRAEHSSPLSAATSLPPLPPLPPLPCPRGSEKVRLRAFTDADAEAILEAAGDYSMHRWLALDRPLPDLASVRRWIQDGHLLYKRGGGLRVAVVETSSAQLLGCVELNFPSPDRERANVGYWTMPRERKHGVASQALALLCDWAFTHDLTQTIDLLTLPGNVASERVALACNFSLADDVLISYDRRLEREVAFNVFSRSH